MKVLEKRLQALEGQRPSHDFRAVLDAMSDADLDRLESLLAARGAGDWSDLADVSAADAELVSSILHSVGDRICAH